MSLLLAPLPLPPTPRFHSTSPKGEPGSQGSREGDVERLFPLNPSQEPLPMVSMVQDDLTHG